MPAREHVTNDAGEHVRNDADLLARTRVDPEAFGAFYRRYERPILGYLLTRVRDAETAADLTSEVFAAALETRAAVRRGVRAAGCSRLPITRW